MRNLEIRRKASLLGKSRQQKNPGGVDRRAFLQAAALVSSAVTMEAGHEPLQAGSASPAAPTAQALYLTDLDRCQPQSALSRKPLPGHWRLLPYETDQHPSGAFLSNVRQLTFQGKRAGEGYFSRDSQRLKGVMLVAGHETDAPEVTYPLHQEGWHAIHLGLCSYIHSSTMEMVTKVQVRLKSDPVFYSMTHLAALRGGVHQVRIDEYFWKHADLSGEDLILRQLPGSLALGGKSSQPAWIAYIKLVPLSDREVEAVMKDRRRKDTRRLFVGPGGGPDTEHTWQESFRHTDFSRLYWDAASGDQCSYPTKIGLRPSREFSKDPYRTGDRLSIESWQLLRKKGIDPFLAAVEHAHGVGVEFHAGYRTAGFHHPPPFAEFTSGGLYERHPEWRGIDRRGRGTPRCSYAFAGVRRFVVSLLAEMAEYPIDGVALFYNRRPPLVEYEKPVVDGFQARYGEDPKQLDERDPRWLSYRATFLTQFMREVREAMEKAARDQNRSKPLEVSAIVMSSREENLYYAMDLEAWIKEGLVDTIIPYTSAPGLDSSKDSWVDPSDAEFFLRITRDTPCKLALNLMPRSLTAKQYRSRAHALYQAGVEHLFFWDGGRGRGGSDSAWEAMRRLGHREEIEAWVRAGSPEFQRPGSELVKLGDWDLSYTTPG